MSQPIITATIKPGYESGLTLYQSNTSSICINDVIDVYSAGDLVQSATTTVAGTVFFSDRLRITASTLPSGLAAATAWSASEVLHPDQLRSFLSGTPSTVASTIVLLKIEVADYYNDGTDHITNLRVGYVSLTLNVVATPSVVTPSVAFTPVLKSIIRLIKNEASSVEMVSSTGIVAYYWSVGTLPTGLSMSGLSIYGTPTVAGESTFTATLFYKPTTTSSFYSVTVTVSCSIVTSAVDFLMLGGSDLFVDLQTMAISLDTPINSLGLPELKKLCVKAGQTTYLNVRFIKGAESLDLDPSSMRFGIASKIGGPLLMSGTTFTKVGSGSSAYFRMRIVSDPVEFGDLSQSYYDDDAVEQILTVGEPTLTDGAQSGICELEFSTGSGGTLAVYRSKSLPANIYRSIFD